MEMNMLKLFLSHNARFSEELDVLPHNLRVLYWREYPGESFLLQSNVRGDNLVVLGMPYSYLEGLNGVEIFQKLTIMNFTNCQFLKEVPDILRISNLVTLILDGCVRLEEVHCSVGFLKKLVYLSLENCFSLRSFPRSLKLISLESLILYGCSRIKNFPEIGCRMEHLKKIDFQYTGIKELPSSIEHLVGVRELYLAGCKRLGGLPDNIEHLKNLECLNLIGCTQIKRLSSFIGWLFGVKKLDLSGCTNLMRLPNSIYQLKYLEQLNLQDCSQMVRFPANRQMRQSMPSNDGYSSLSFPKLQQLDLRNCSLSRSNFFKKFDCGSSMNRLDLSGSDINILPPCIKRFVGLKWLLLNECKQLRNISELPQNVKAVYARGCTALKRFQFNIYPALGWIDLSNCRELRENMGNDMQTHLMSEGRVEDHKFACVFPGNKISDWFDHRQEVVNSNSCKIYINQLAHLDWKITRIAFSAVIGTKADIPDVQDGIYSDGQDEDNENFEIIFEVIRDGEKIYSFVEENISHRFHSDHVWLHYSVPDSFKLKGDNLQVKFQLRYEEKVEDVMDGDQLSKRRRGGDDDNGYLESTWYPQKRHCSTLGT
ncbi:disease resistance protein RPV1-like [Corylus avellana]|uniref:disease resistance protein RPV1-like n=1 Tax=Corylus avellana TaxID=13451 RepID=UPI00286B4FB9|nr:disease resistance protein RPV1-like [Corylus avellana]